MPSVITTWSGRCPKRQKQNALSRYLKVLAEINHGYWVEHPAPIAGINRAMHRAAGIAPLTGPTWREFDIRFQGRIVVSGDVVRRGSGDARESNADLTGRMREAGLPTFTAEMYSACYTSISGCRFRMSSLELLR